ncbi:MAG TPA: LysR substrate-binding domain-containing protein, partial [Bacilli bacterium]|nr:LysR substrate-binding domain-containing protein [Bacilli bacterium]
YLLPRILADFVREYPEVEVQVRIANTEEIGQMMLNHRLDIGLVEGRLEERRLLVTPFLEDEMLLLAAPDHPLAGNEVVSAEDLAQETFVMREAGSGTRVVAEAALARIGLPLMQTQASPRKQLVISSTHAIKELVERGVGLTLLSKWCVQKERQYGTLVPLQTGAGQFTRPLAIVEREQQFLTRTVQAFRERVVAFGEREEEGIRS